MKETTGMSDERVRYCVCGAIIGKGHDHEARLREGRITWMERVIEVEIEMRVSP